MHFQSLCPTSSTQAHASSPELWVTESHTGEHANKYGANKTDGHGVRTQPQRL